MFRVFVAVLLSMGSFECVAGPPAIAITHVNVLPMTPAGAPLNDMTVTIRNGRIDSITATSATRVPKGVRAIDGRGKWLMPGFSDMHMHLENDRMGRLHVGVDVESGRVLGPHIATAAMIDGSPP